ncbi:hypothetical protein EVAR_97181_1 [Eumeta japonica]|uniref:Uncharacterized protein n=1 Tax=Eumeta variegata TaxID=151549 RepID=A0A4C1WG98_EUMVA|nr:hypothetical protein EVAR_97181_1 [Eumeta japonica]
MQTLVDGGVANLLRRNHVTESRRKESAKDRSWLKLEEVSAVRQGGAWPQKDFLSQSKSLPPGQQTDAYDHPTDHPGSRYKIVRRIPWALGWPLGGLHQQLDTLLPFENCPVEDYQAVTYTDDGYVQDEDGIGVEETVEVTTWFENRCRERI